MKELTPRFKTRIATRLTPNYRVATVADIDIKTLKKNHVKAIAFDADSTLVEHDQIVIRPETIDFLKSLNIPLFIATNRKVPLGDELGELIGARAVMHARPGVRKPGLEYFNELEDLSGMELCNMALVGDRLLTDIYGANRAGMQSIYVAALGKDPWYMRWTGLRRIETTLAHWLGIVSDRV